MALTPRLGSLITPSNPNNVPNDIPNTQSDPTANMPFISNASLNKPGIDTTQYLNATKQILGFMKGKRTPVTYYRSINRDAGNNRTNIADFATTRNVLDSEYQKILNLEITLPKGFDFTVNNDMANASITGSAMFYPYMNPSIGDIFLTGIGDGRTAVCRISSVAPASYRQDTVYIAEFSVQQFLTTTTYDAIEGSVTATYVFSKKNYLGGTASLLSETTYLQLQQIEATRTNLCRQYHETFFDRNMCSYLRPDGIYDPWAVAFMTNKITMDDIPIRPKNLLGSRPQFYKKTLWSRLEERYNTSLYGVDPYYCVKGYRETRMGVFITELYGHSIIFTSPTGDDTDTYIYSSNFYTGQVSAMTPEELLMYNAVTLRDCGDLTSLIMTYLNPVYTLSLDDQFYKIPLYIHLIDMALQSQYRQIDAPSMNFGSTSDTGE